MEYTIKPSKCLYSVMQENKKRAVFKSDNREDFETWIEENAEICENCKYENKDPLEDYPCNDCSDNDHGDMGVVSHFKKKVIKNWRPKE